MTFPDPEQEFFVPSNNQLQLTSKLSKVIKTLRVVVLFSYIVENATFSYLCTWGPFQKSIDMAKISPTKQNNTRDKARPITGSLLSLNPTPHSVFLFFAQLLTFLVCSNQKYLKRRLTIFRSSSKYV